MRFSIIAMSGVAAVLLASTAPANAQDTLKIGVVMTLSGQFADAGIQMQNGVKTYMKEHGETVGGKKIELIVKDSGGMAPDVAKRLTQELVVRDKVDIIAGFVLTPNALAAGDVSAEAKKFMVVMNAATSIVTTKSPYMVRSSVTLPQVAETFGTWAATKGGIKKSYTMVTDYGPGHDFETGFQRAFKEAGGEITGSVRFPVANPDFSAFVQRAKESNADAIYIWIPGGTQPAAVGKAFAERGIDPKKTRILGQDVLADESALKSMGDIAIGIVTAAHFDYNHQSAKGKAFAKAFHDDYKRYPDIFSIGGYDGMHLIYETLKKTGGKADGDSLIAAAKGMKWESPRGPVEIDPETRDINLTVYIQKVEKTPDGLRNVEIDKYENVKDPVKARMK